jgi:hypothetical protein
MNGRQAKRARKVIADIRVNDEPLPTEHVLERSNARKTPCKFLLAGLFWVMGMTIVETVKHSRATQRGAYRALKRRLKQTKEKL